MPSMRGFLRSKPKTDDGEGELAESQLVARLAGLFGEMAVDTAESDGQLGDEAATNGTTNGATNGALSPHAPADRGHAQNGKRPGPGRPYLGRPPIIVIGEAPIIVTATEPEPAGEPAELAGVEASAGDRIVEPVGVMAQAGDDIGEDSWQLPARPEPVAPAKPARKRPSRARRVPAQPDVDEAVPVTGPDPVVALAAGPEAAPPPVGELATVPVAVDEIVAPVDVEPGPSAELEIAPEATAELVPGPTQGPEIAPVSAPPARRSHEKRPVVAAVVKAKPVVVSAVHCPYCGVLLDPPPAASRKCEECQQRIIVKRIDGRAVYLAGAALPVFTAERRRIANSARLTRDRSRWLDLASAAGAPSRAVAQLRIARATDANVGAARELYLAAVERAVRMAKRDKEWEAAARLRRDEATAIHRAEGSTRPPSAEVVGLYRDGVAAELRGIAEISRDAQLVAATCCEACRADDEVVTRIATELRQPRLPHAGCPRGLCRCHWDLAARDRTTLLRYLRRRSPSASRAPSTETPPAR